MFKECRLGCLPNSPEGWAHNFHAAKPSLVSDLKRRFSPEFRLIRKYLSSPILDAGCGTGDWVSFLSRHGYTAQGLDYSSELIARDRRTYPHLTWTAGDIRQIPLPDSSIGGIISWGVIEHDEAGPLAALREFHRILRPGGRCIVTVPVDSARMRQVGLAGNESNSGEFFQYYFTPDELAAEVRRTGFAIVRSGVVPQVSIALAAPKLYSQRRYQLARLAALFCSVERCAGMTVCIGQK